MRGIRPRPLLVAVVAGVAWAVFSVGPSQLVTDLDLLIPRDAITAPLPVCSAGYGLTPSGTCASTAFPMSTLCEQIGTCTPAPVIAAPRPTLICGDLLGASVLPSFEETLEADQMCHDRSGGTVGPLIDDLLDGAKAWLLAFLAVGSALLIWPRLQKAGSPTA